MRDLTQCHRSDDFYDNKSTHIVSCFFNSARDFPSAHPTRLPARLILTNRSLLPLAPLRKLKVSGKVANDFSEWSCCYRWDTSELWDWKTVVEFGQRKVLIVRKVGVRGLARGSNLLVKLYIFERVKFHKLLAEIVESKNCCLLLLYFVQFLIDSVTQTNSSLNCFVSSNIEMFTFVIVYLEIISNLRSLTRNLQPKLLSRLVSSL